MTARIFISYRSSDGKDKATALARDLGAVFGEEQVFLDKDDLRGGSTWRAEVQRLLDQRPALLLLMTPDLLGATDGAGRRRIEDPEDPVRREFGEALAAGAQIIPVLCDGLEAPPEGSDLPAPFDQIGQRTWRRLRAYDWQSDVQRLVQDLRDLGVPSARAVPASPVPRAGHRRTLWIGLALAALLGAGIAAVVLRGAAPSNGVGGEWASTVPGLPTMSLVLRHEGDKLVLTSTPVALEARAEWADYRRFWRERFGTELNHVVYRGEGTVRTDPGVPLTIDVALRIVSSPGETLIDGGNLQATLDTADKTLNGKLWLNSEQADRPITLQRRPM